MRVLAFNACLVASVLVNLCVVIVVIFRAARPRFPAPPLLTSPVLLAGAVVLVILVLLEVVLIGLLSRGLFAAIHVVYLNGVVTLPLIAAVVLLRSRGYRRSRAEPGFTPSARVLAVVALLPAAMGLYASYIEPRQIEVVLTQCRLPNGRGPVSPLRIAVLADLQFDRVGAHEHRAVTLAMAAAPDLILLPGDVYQGDERGYRQQRESIRALLQRLDAPGGVFVVEGDVDRVDRLQDMTAGTRVQLIHNEVVAIDLPSKRIALGGLALRYDAPAAQMAITKLEAKAGTVDLAVLLAHRPGVALSLPVGSPIDLVVAGHTHGGQVRFPWLGPPLTLSPVPRQVAAGGLHRLRGVGVYVSRGVGMERGLAPRIRFHCRPEVSVLVVSGAGTTTVDPGGAMAETTS